MEESRLKVQKTAKILYIVSKIARIVLMISCVAVLVMMIFGFIFQEELLDEIESIVANESIVDMFEDVEMSDINHRYLIIISGVIIHVISRIVSYIFVYAFGKILKSIADGNQPFTKENSKKIFYLSIAFVVYVVVNPFLAIVLILFGMFLAHLISYGAYLHNKAEETNHIQENMIVSFAEVVENKSEQTGLHVKRVAEYSKVLAKSLGYSEEEAEKIKMASMMHDIGKLLVPSEILEKPARLTDEEFQEIKKHPGYGVKLLKDVDGDVLLLARQIAHEHHERVDGHGYPEGLDKANISMEGRIMAVADVYDALTSKRSYKDAWNPEDAYKEILKGKGTQFDDKVVDAFTKSYDEINKIREKFVD